MQQCHNTKYRDLERLFVSCFEAQVRTAHVVLHLSGLSTTEKPVLSHICAIGCPQQGYKYGIVRCITGILPVMLQVLLCIPSCAKPRAGKGSCGDGEDKGRAMRYQGIYTVISCSEHQQRHAYIPLPDRETVDHSHKHEALRLANHVVWHMSFMGSQNNE
jgi:hypothetical protein